MEGIGDKLTRIQGDVEKILTLYEYAENLYPYDKIRESRSVCFF